MRKFEIGKPIDGYIRQYPEGVKFDVDKSGAMLFIMFRNPSDSEIENIRKGRIQLGICSLSDIIFMLFKFGQLQWMDAPFSIHLAQDQDFLNIDFDETQGLGMTVFLVDAATGILKALRYIGLPHKLTQLFFSEVNNQIKYIFNKSEYDKNLNEIFMRYGTTDLVRFSQTFRLEGDK